MCMQQVTKIELDRACACFDQSSSLSLEQIIGVFFFLHLDYKKKLFSLHRLDWNNTSRYQNEICFVLFDLQCN